MSNDQSLLEQVADVLDRHGVEYIVVGGAAENLMGSPRTTMDVDLCYRRTPTNLEALAAALRELRVTLRGAPPGLPFIIDARTLGHGLNFTFSCALGDLDMLGEIEPIGGFDALAVHAESFDRFRTISLDDLIRAKEHIKRPKDFESLLQLRAIRASRGKPGYQ